MANTLRQRLLKDVAEIQTKPYPNIALRLHDDNDLTHACLVLTVESYGNMHLTVEPPKDYPLNPPRVQMNSNISHPNIFVTYICSSILNTTEGYTSAYTLKGIAIQLLSFFSSDRVEQTGGGEFIDLSTYKAEQSNIRDTYTCSKCRFGTASFNIESNRDRNEARPQASPCATLSTSYEDLWPTPRESSQAASPSPSASFGLVSKQSGQSPILGRNARRRKAKQNAETRARTAVPGPLERADSSAMDLDEPEEARYRRNLVDMKLPNEIILFICDQLETEDLMCFAQAWSRIPRLMAQFDMIRTRELQCFCLKESYLAVNLGVGVHIDLRTKSIESEFDLLSEVGFKAHKIRRSTQGRAFEHSLSQFPTDIGARLLDLLGTQLKILLFHSKCNRSHQSKCSIIS
jgi:ubiquitin-protein ligase